MRLYVAIYRLADEPPTEWRPVNLRLHRSAAAAAHAAVDFARDALRKLGVTRAASNAHVKELYRTAAGPQAVPVTLPGEPDPILWIAAAAITLTQPERAS